MVISGGKILFRWGDTLLAGTSDPSAHYAYVKTFLPLMVSNSVLGPSMGKGRPNFAKSILLMGGGKSTEQ